MPPLWTAVACVIAHCRCRALDQYWSLDFMPKWSAQSVLHNSSCLCFHARGMLCTEFHQDSCDTAQHRQSFTFTPEHE